MNGHAVLVGMPYSVWTEAARWALDWRRVPHRLREHVPFLGEPLARRAARRAGGVKPTTPYLLVDGLLTEGPARVGASDGAPVFGALAIARWAEAHGTGPTLAPGADFDAVERVDALAERVRQAGRALVVNRLLGSDAALDESHPGAIPRALRPLLRPVARHATRFIAEKYGVLGKDDGEGSSELARALEALDAARGGRETFLDEPSYADVSAAVAVQVIAPVGDAHLPLGPAVRAAWTREELAPRFAELVAWRDRFYDARRRAPANAAAVSGTG